MISLTVINDCTNFCLVESYQMAQRGDHKLRRN